MRDRGSAGLWTVWSTALVLTATVAALGWAAAIGARQRAEAAADLAALAAATAQVRAGDACGAAARVARAHGARLVGCTEETAAVSVLVEFAGSSALLRRLDIPPARARARAGVPP